MLTLEPTSAGQESSLVDEAALLALAVSDADGPVDADVDAIVLDPDGLVAAAELTHADAGRWEVRWTPDSAGIWRVRWTVADLDALGGVQVVEWPRVVTATGESLPFGATVESTRARVLDVARPTGAAPVGGTRQAARVPDARVVEWLLEGGARVGRKLRLLDSLGASETDPRRLEYRAAARGLTETYAAALLWDATYPQASKDATRYGAVLYERYEKGLAELAADLAVDVEAQTAGAPGVDPDPDDTSMMYGGAAIFPPRDPRLSRTAPW